MGSILQSKLVKSNPGDFTVGPVVKTVLPLQGTWVQALIREIRSCMLQGLIIIIFKSA